MSHPVNSTHDIWENIAPELRRVMEGHLSAGELPLVWLEPDLDRQLNYSKCLVVLTDRRLLSVEPADGTAELSANGKHSLQSWPVDSSLTLRAKEYAGAGMLELIGPESRLYHWRFTSGRVNAAHQIVIRFERLQQGDQSEEEDSAESLGAVCPSCGALLAPEQTTCPGCEAAKAKPPMQSLSRLISFAKPRALVIAVRFWVDDLQHCRRFDPDVFAKAIDQMRC